jgi:hypothetical protein
MILWFIGKKHYFDFSFYIEKRLWTEEKFRATTEKYLWGNK